MRFAVETWAPEYGVGVEGGALDASSAPIDVNIECPAADWAPVRPSPSASRPARVLFVDGVRRVDARIWIDDGNGGASLGLCATVAAGVVCADPGRAHLLQAQVARAVYSASPSLAPIQTTAGWYDARVVADASPEGLILGVQQRMAALEVEVTRAVPDAELIIVDGPLRGREELPGVVGYVKTQHVRYLPDALQAVVGTLACGERTPLFAIGGQWTRLSWYVRLPGVLAHPLSGIVRCEVGATMAAAHASAVADAVTRLLPGFASSPHKDARAPQNLYPIAGLERELRRRLGDPKRAERALRLAAA